MMALCSGALWPCLAHALLHVASLAPEVPRLDQLTNHPLNPLQIVGARARSFHALIAKVF